MLRFNTEWRASYEGHTIVVRNWWNLFLFTGEELWVDGALKDRRGGMFRLNSTLAAAVPLAGEMTAVRAYLFPLDATRVGCHIYVNDRMIGGDTDVLPWRK
jgi:hypothetical protein